MPKPNYPNVIAFGTALIDLVQYDVNKFILTSGGTPVNVSIAASRLGISSAVIASVGDDYFGLFLQKTLATNNVNTSALVLQNNSRTSFSINFDTHLDKRQPYIYRESDFLIDIDQFDSLSIGSPSLFCFSSSSLAHLGMQHSLEFAMQKYIDQGAKILFDLNIRLSLWDSQDFLIEKVNIFLKKSHIVKANLEEVTLMTGLSDPVSASMLLWQDNFDLLVITLQDSGCFFMTKTDHGFVHPFIVDNSYGDSLGAGDAFVGALCSGIIAACQSNNSFIYTNTLRSILLRANAAGAITTTGKGAIVENLNIDTIEKMISQKNNP